MTFLSNLNQTIHQHLVPRNKKYRITTPLDERYHQPDGYCMEVAFRDDGLLEKDDAPLLPKTYQKCRCDKLLSKSMGVEKQEKIDNSKAEGKQNVKKTPEPKYVDVITWEYAWPFPWTWCKDEVWLVKEEIKGVWKELEFGREVAKEKKREEKSEREKQKETRRMTEREKL